MSGQAINLFFFFLNSSVSSRLGHDEVAGALCSQLWQLQANRYEPYWHVCFARATDCFSFCNLCCSDASALQIICRMRLYHRWRGSLAHWHSSNVPHVYARYSEYIQSLFEISDQPMDLAAEYPEIQQNTFKEVKSLTKSTVQSKLIELAICFLGEKLSSLKS